MPATSAASAGRRTRIRAVATPWLFATPAIVFFTLFLIIPIGYALYLSFRGFRVEGGGACRPSSVSTTTSPRSPTPNTSPGSGGCCSTASSPSPACWAWPCSSRCCSTPRGCGRGFTRTAIFLPYAVPGVIASLLWGFLYLPSTSPLTYLAERVHAGPLDFFGFPALYFSLANIALWSGVGYNMIIIFTSLRAIPASVYEAARIDGASELQIAWRIKIPLVSPALVLTGLFSVIGTLQLYSEPATLRPMSTTISASWVPLMKIYQEAFMNDNLGGAAAASVVLALGILVLSLLLLRFFQRRTFGDNA